MKTSAVIAILLAMLLFMGLVVSLTVQGAQVECEVCLDIGGQEVCRLGRGGDEAEALQAAQESACGGNVSGMAELIACRSQTPTRATCDL
jgi:hypothetical protein